MRLLLDTTYFLPAIGVSVKKLSNDALVRLMREGHQVSMCDISVFELSAKGAKHVASGSLSAERVARGIRAIVYDERIEMIPAYESALLLTAFKLRRMLDDFVDCLVLSSAMLRCDALVTEDRDIHSLRGNREFVDLLSAVNRKFKIQTLTETL